MRTARWFRNVSVHKSTFSSFFIWFLKSRIIIKLLADKKILKPRYAETITKNSYIKCYGRAVRQRLPIIQSILKRAYTQIIVLTRCMKSARYVSDFLCDRDIIHLFVDDQHLPEPLTYREKFAEGHRIAVSCHKNATLHFKNSRVCIVR